MFSRVWLHVAKWKSDDYMINLGYTPTFSPWCICMFVHSRFTRYLPAHFLSSDLSLFLTVKYYIIKTVVSGAPMTPLTNHAAGPRVSSPRLSWCSGGRGPSPNMSGQSGMPTLLLTTRQTLWCYRLLSTWITRRFQPTLKSHLSGTFHQY